ncbi:hypothetical protein B9K06_12625 [Bacillus sp. OG2]|nr:hypothetical protein B9K06_12625 [Bacillus sp. OG2]
MAKRRYRKKRYKNKIDKFFQQSFFYLFVLIIVLQIVSYIFSSIIIFFQTLSLTGWLYTALFCLGLIFLYGLSTKHEKKIQILKQVE